MTIYDAPGITYDGMVINGSMIEAVDRITQVWQHMNLDSLTPGGFTKEAVASAVVSALQATTIPVNNTLINGAPVIGDGSEANPWRGAGVSP